MGDSLLDQLPGGRIIAKDLAIASSLVPGNPYCRYNTDTKERKYCSKDLWDTADEKFIIPENADIPRPLIVCECCEQDSYQTEDAECGRCGKPMFDCPNDDCDALVHGKPDECPECGVGYNWPDSGEDA
jgi:hypothetical protein